PRKLKRLGKRYPPDRPVSQVVSTEVAHALASQFGAQLGVRPLARSPTPATSCGDFGFVELELRILRDDLVSKDRRPASCAILRIATRNGLMMIAHLYQLVDSAGVRDPTSSGRRAAR